MPGSSVAPMRKPSQRQSETVPLDPAATQTSVGGGPAARANSVSRRESTVSQLSNLGKKAMISIPFSLAVTIEIMISCIAIAAVILGLTSANTSSSNDLCINQGVESVLSLAKNLQAESADLIAAKVQDILSEPVGIMQQNMLFFNSTFLIARDYDRLWPVFYQQIQQIESLSLVYFIDGGTKDYIGTRRMNYEPPYVYGVDLQDEGRFSNQSRCTRTCPPEIRNNTRRMQRFQFTLDSSMRIITPAYSVATYDGTTRSGYTAVQRVNFSTPVWATPHIFANNIDVGVNAAVPFYNTTDPSRPVLQGIFAIGMGFGVLKKALVALPLSENGVAFVFDATGTLFGSNVVNETSIATVNGTAAFKTIRNITDPLTNFAATSLLDSVPGGVPVLPTGGLNLTGRIPDNASFSVTIPPTLVPYLRGAAAGPNTQRTMIILTRAIRDPYGLNLWVVIAAPLADFSGGIDNTSVELRGRLGNNIVVVVGIGIALVVGFVALSVPITHFTEEAARFDFGSLHSRKGTTLSFIKELGSMQSSYWGMIMKFAAAIQDNKRLVSNSKGVKSDYSSVSYAQNSQI
ncbi:hypothetical protein HDU96_003512 [Phlyctochytrium bullatum]|nr:hypothetical protein HDU96_003512 [Phlyctochytrium bullatum]